jgi:maleate isomerase
VVAEAIKDTTRWSEISYDLDRGIGWRAHIGMVIISNDQTLPCEARAMLAVPGVALYESRLSTIRQRNEPVTAGNLRDQVEKIDGAVRQINTMRSSDVVALGCTSAAMVIGAAELERKVRAVHPGARVTNPFTAIIAALRAVGASRVGYVSPYPEDLASRMVHEIEANGVSVPLAISFRSEGGCIGDEAPFISPQSISEAVRHAVESADIDTVVVACTQMRAAGIIDELEDATGKTILSSNQALCWHALRLAGYEEPVLGWGRLFRTKL